MGTTSKITEKRINKKIRWGAYVTTPLLTLGIITLLLQLFFSPFSSDFMNLNFDLGKLWPWTKSPNETELVIDENILQDNNAASIAEFNTRNGLELLRELNRIKKVIKPREVHDMNQNVRNQDSRIIQFDQVSIQSVEVKKIENIDQTFGKINLSEKEYLISPEMNVNRSRFAVGISFTPGYSYRTMAPRTGGTFYRSGQSIMYRDQNDQPILNFYGGLDLFFNLTPRLTIQSGLYYSSMGERLYMAAHADGEHNMVTSGESDEAFRRFNAMYESPEMVEAGRERIPFNNYYGYLEVPLLVNYRMWKKNNINLDVQAGLSYSYLNHVDAMVYDFESDAYYWISKRSFDYLNRHNANAYIGVSVSQYITPNVEIFANPQFRFSMRSTFSEEYSLKQHQYSSGVRLGMKVNL